MLHFRGAFDPEAVQGPDAIPLPLGGGAANGRGFADGGCGAL